MVAVPAHLAVATFSMETPGPTRVAAAISGPHTEQIEVAALIVITPLHVRGIDIAILLPGNYGSKRSVAISGRVIVSARELLPGVPGSKRIFALVPGKGIGQAALSAALRQKMAGPAIVVIAAPKDAEDGQEQSCSFHGHIGHRCSSHPF
jgi:hypothetical protein